MLRSEDFVTKLSVQRQKKKLVDFILQKLSCLYNVIALVYKYVITITTKLWFHTFLWNVFHSYAMMDLEKFKQ